MKYIKGLDLNMIESRLIAFTEHHWKNVADQPRCEWKEYILLDNITEFAKILSLRETPGQLMGISLQEFDVKDPVEVRQRVKTLSECFFRDIRSMYFVGVEESRIDYLKTPLSNWPSIENIAAGSEKYITQAAECFALKLWTQCVYSLMLVVENALRTLPNNANLPEFIGPQADQFQWGNWLRILEDYIKVHSDDNNFKGASAHKKRAAKEKRTQLSIIAAQVRVIKNAYRDPVSHGLKDYTEGEANGVYVATKDAIREFSLL